MQRLTLPPQDSHRDRPEGAVALGALVVAGGQAPVLLGAVDEILASVAEAVKGPVERPGAALIAPARDGGADAAAAAAGAAPPAGPVASRKAGWASRASRASRGSGR
jgi:hypothetical protein